VTTLRDLARKGVIEFSDGYRTRRDEHASDGYRILRAGDVRDGRIYPDGPDFIRPNFARAIGAKAARVGDVVLTTKGTVGRTGLVVTLDTDVVYSPQVCFFRTDQPDVLDSRFLYHWLSSPEFVEQAGYLKSATDMAPYISLKDLGSTRIDLPPLGTQQAIAEVLGALDDKIAVNGKVIESASDLMVVLVASLAPNMAPVPLAELARSVKVALAPAEMREVRHYSLPAFDAGQLPTRDSGTTILSAKLQVNEPSVLLSRLNPRIPRVWDVPQPAQPAVASTEFLVLDPDTVSTGALWAALSQPSTLARLQELARGTSGSHQRVRPDDAMTVHLPDVRKLSAVQMKMICDLSLRRHVARSESVALAELRDTLLPHLMSGRITVREAEKQVEEAL